MTVRLIGWALGAVAFLAIAGCKPRPLILRVSATSLAREQQITHVCPAGASACSGEAVLDQSDFNQSRNVFFPLHECPAGIGRILIRKNAGQLEALVTCLDATQVPSVEATCPAGTEPVPDPVHGGLTCGEP